MTRFSLGVDVGGSAVKMALLREGAEPVARRGRSHEGAPQDEATAAAGDLFAELLDAAGAAVRQITSAGVAVAGVIDDRGVVEQAVSLPWLENRPVGRWLARAVGADLDPVTLTDAAAAALGEHHLDPLPGRVVYLSLGTGVGGAVLDDGRPLTVTRGTPGHFGHIDVSGGDPDAPSLASCGRGSLQAYVGAAALDEADGPDHPAMRRAVSALARAVRILLAIYRPGHVVLLGGLAPAFEPVLADLRRQVADGLTPAAPPRWDIRCGRSDQFAAAVGAARFAMGEGAGPGEPG